jgi:hypothetical protein
LRPKELIKKSLPKGEMVCNRNKSEIRKSRRRSGQVKMARQRLKGSRNHMRSMST